MCNNLSIIQRKTKQSWPIICKLKTSPKKIGFSNDTNVCIYIYYMKYIHMTYVYIKYKQAMFL